MTTRRLQQPGLSLALCVCLALLLVATACNQAPPDTRAADEAAVRDADVQWSKTAAAHDLEGTIAFYSDDAIVLPPNEPTTTGKQAIRALWAPMVAPDASISWEAGKVEVARSGDLAYTTGTYQLTMRDEKGNPVPDKGKFLEVWKKQADGKWKTVADIFNSDLPAIPASPE